MRPIVSTTKQRRDAVPAWRTRSIESTIMFSALSAPTLSSVPGMLLSIVAGSRINGIWKAG